MYIRLDQGHLTKESGFMIREATWLDPDTLSDTVEVLPPVPPSTKVSFLLVCYSDADTSFLSTSHVNRDVGRF